jgi:hypothetical protein
MDGVEGEEARELECASAWAMGALYARAPGWWWSGTYSVI